MDLITNTLIISGIILFLIVLVLNKLYCNRLGDWKNNIIKIIAFMLAFFGVVCSAFGIWFALGFHF